MIHRTCTECGGYAQRHAESCHLYGKGRQRQNDEWSPEEVEPELDPIADLMRAAFKDDA